MYVQYHQITKLSNSVLNNFALEVNFQFSLCPIGKVLTRKLISIIFSYGSNEIGLVLSTAKNSNLLHCGPLHCN